MRSSHRGSRTGSVTSDVARIYNNCSSGKPSGPLLIEGVQPARLAIVLGGGGRPRAGATARPPSDRGEGSAGLRLKGDDDEARRPSGGVLGLRPRGREEWIERSMRAGGVEPPRAEARRIFLPSTAFAAPAGSATEVWGLDYPFTVPRTQPRFRCCPSSLYTFPEVASGLGSGLPFDRFPRVWAVLLRQFPGEHSSWSESAASACSATPAW
jgi:hypothetical protein